MGVCLYVLQWWSMQSVNGKRSKRTEYIWVSLSPAKECIASQKNNLRPVSARLDKGVYL